MSGAASVAPAVTEARESKVRRVSGMMMFLPVL
jgi:hypothetical protein